MDGNLLVLTKATEPAVCRGHQCHENIVVGDDILVINGETFCHVCARVKISEILGSK